VGADVQSFALLFCLVDPTGHVKETPEQETVEKGAVGEVIVLFIL
jgi:hypothetical protein